MIYIVVIYRGTVSIIIISRNTGFICNSLINKIVLWYPGLQKSSQASKVKYLQKFLYRLHNLNGCVS